MAGLAVALTLAGCSVAPEGGAPGYVHDPYETVNRNTHELNLMLDRRILRPAGKGAVKVIPKPVGESIGNFAANLNLPATVANNLLQGNLGGALQNTARFAVNTLFGLGGLADPASEFGLNEVETDFGATLHVWGVPEGAYVELPLAGPSTERDAVGLVVDLFTNPLSYIVPSPEKYYGTGAKILAKVDDRGRYSDTIDSILYESADSYAQARIIYLQNRRFELGGNADDTYVDPYEDSFGDPYADPYAE